MTIGPERTKSLRELAEVLLRRPCTLTMAEREMIHFSITTCALFNFYNRRITATGAVEMSEDTLRQQGRHLARLGYVRDGNG
jgi:hypothetical protein